MAKRLKKIDSRVEIGHVHVDVDNLDRALVFYEGVLGFEITLRIGHSRALLTAGAAHHHIELRAGDAGPKPSSSAASESSRFALRYPNRPALADALRRLSAAGVSLERSEDAGISVALYIRDPDGNAVELYYERPREEWPRAADGTIATVTEPVDLESLRAVVEGKERAVPVPTEGAEGAALMDATRTRLGDMRTRLLNLHKVLLEDAKATYEMDRGRVGSNASLLQLVISDPWFAWLHPLSELVVRIDETLQADVAAREADGVVLLDQVTRLLSPELGPDEFARRYYEALQRQPAVIVAHAEVRRILKQASGQSPPNQ
jgi:catechol 2,3-dioxygenase